MLILNTNQITGMLNDCQQITDDALNHLDKNNSRLNREELTLIMNALQAKLDDFYALVNEYESRELNDTHLAKNGTKVIHVGQAKTRMLEDKLNKITKILNEEAY